MSRSIRILLCAVAASVLALPAAAHASSRQTMSFEAPRDLRDPATREAALDEIRSLGVDALRIILYWQDVAPSPRSRIRPQFEATDPAGYDWSAYDAAIEGARARGMRILLTVTGPVPRWATNGARDNVTRPSPNEFQQFMQAVGRRYGQSVEAFSIWNEPNQPQFLGPQHDARGRPASPRVYRGLVFAALRGLRRVGLQDKPVLLGETSPQGTGRVVAPLTFLRGTLCLDAHYRRAKGCARLDVDGYAHHAYTTKAGPLFRPPSPNAVTIGVLPRLTRALDRAGATGAIPRHLPLWLTEFGIQSVPDPAYGVSFLRQAEYRAIAERIAWENPRVVWFSQYLLRDDLPRTGGPRSQRYSGFESGLRTATGRPKIALAAFPLPLAARIRDGRVSLWGLVRRATGPTTVVVEGSSRRGYRRLAQVRTTARESWRLTTALRAGRRYRVRWTAPDGRTFTSPGMRAYR
jgi:Cellulase (glycosyl hydrolase family 5)